MAKEGCTIQVHVRRTGEIASVDVVPMVTTYGRIIKTICESMNDPHPDRYYIAMNSESEMPDDAVFESRHEHEQFQMILRTKWIIEHIAEGSMQKRVALELTRPGGAKEPVAEERSPPADTSSQTSRRSRTTSISPTTDDPSNPTLDDAPGQNKPILGDVVRSTIERIPNRDVQKYLHRALGKSFDILLMGSPRVGKSTLINAILKKDIAQTSAGRNACTDAMASYEYQESYTSSRDNDASTTSTCSIRIWDAPGIEDWTKLDVAKHIQNLVKEKNPICLIYCASPGSYADVEHIKVVIEQCKKLKVFVALVVTNMYASDEVDEILETFKSLLLYHSIETNAGDDVFYYGTVGLCTTVNSVVYESQGVVMKVAGVDDLMLGIMNSLSEEKLLQWCFALIDNGPFWIRAQSRIWKTFGSLKRWFGY